MVLRVKTGLTQEQLGKKVGVSKGQISRIESGKTAFSLDMAYKIADALGESVTSVIGLEEAVKPDLEPFKAPASSDIALLTARPHRAVYRVLTQVLDEKGIERDCLVVLDTSANTDAHLTPLAVVALELHDKHDEANFKIILRQFVPPNLFTTNSRTANYPAINRMHETIKLIGLVLFHHPPLS